MWNNKMSYFKNVRINVEFGKYQEIKDTKDTSKIAEVW